MNKFNSFFFNYLKYFYKLSYQNLHKTDKNYNFFCAVTAISIPESDSVTFVLLAVTVSIFAYLISKPLFTTGKPHYIPEDLPKDPTRTGYPNIKPSDTDFPFILDELPANPRKIYEFSLNECSIFDVFGNNLDLFNMNLFEEALQYVCMTQDWTYMPYGWVHYLLRIAPPQFVSNIFNKMFLPHLFPATYKIVVPTWFYLTFPNSTKALFIPTSLVLQTIYSLGPDNVCSILSNTTDPIGFSYFYDLILNQASELLKSQPNNEFHNIVLNEMGKVSLKNHTYIYCSKLIWVLFATTTVIVHVFS